MNYIIKLSEILTLALAIIGLGFSLSSQPDAAAAILLIMTGYWLVLGAIIAYKSKNK